LFIRETAFVRRLTILSMTRAIKGLMLIGVIVFAAIGFITVAKYAAVWYSVGHPEFSISGSLNSPPASVNFTYVGEGQVTVTRFLINGRAGESGCDSSAPPKEPYWIPVFPRVLKTGDALTIKVGGCTARDILSVVIFTDHGTASTSDPGASISETP